MLNAILAGQLLGTAFAAGLNLYATVALLSIGIRNDWLTGLPAGLDGLGNGIVIGSALTLYVIGFLADRVPLIGAAWEAVHTLIRPAAAAGLAVLALQDMAVGWQLVASGAAAGTALAAHGSKAGLRLILAARVRPSALVRAGVSLLEDSLAVAIAATALFVPESAPLLILASAALLVLAGPRLWRAAMLGPRGTIARGRAFFGRPGWRSREQLPRRLRAVVPAEPLGRGPARATAAAIKGLGGVGAYRAGWLVFTCDGPRFVYRALFRSRSRELAGISQVRLRPGLMADALDVSTNGGSNGRRDRTFTIYLLKDGPSADVAAAELTTEST
jgi:hypothetical protein